MDQKSHSKKHSLLEAWPTMSPKEREATINAVERDVLDEIFIHLSTSLKTELLTLVKKHQRWSLVHLLPPDDLTDVIQALPEELQAETIDSLEPFLQAEVKALLAYKEDQAGGRMNPRYARLRPEMTVEEGIRYLRNLTRFQAELIYQAYVVDPENKLLGVVSLRQLFANPPTAKLGDVMHQGEDLIKVPENMDQEEISRLFKKKGFTALPVVDNAGHIKGIVTVDDMVKVVQEEATEDFQKLGGMEALDAPYFSTAFIQLVRKRAGWLLVLFIGEMFTATAMGYFEHEIEKAVVLALFIPLIISSGGNSGSQASTLIIRAMALGEVRIRDWWRVCLRESAAGLALGAILGLVGFCRIVVWPARHTLYGEHFMLVGLTVAFSLVGIVMWGAIAGSMLPFILRKLKFDPATASAPFVATLVDVSGLVIYFSVASIFLSGTLL